jgi:putative membrane protein
MLTVLQDFNGLLLFGVYLSAGVAMLVAFTWLYLRITPYDEAAEISKVNMAPAIALAGAMVGFTFPLLAASYTHSNFIGFLAWGVLSRLVSCWRSGSCTGCCRA